MSQLLTKENLVEDGLVSLTNAMAFLSIGRSTLYELMDKGILPYAKIGHSRRIPKRALIRVDEQDALLPFQADRGQQPRRVRLAHAALEVQVPRQNSPCAARVPAPTRLTKSTCIVPRSRMRSHRQQRCPECTHHYDCAVVQFDGSTDRRLLCWQCLHRFCTVLNSLRCRL